ncbi:kinesin-like protein KIN-7N [Primulina tabacum]|uniref:kinesin-like protein KIN-7N n=1 Tax=Primulina tabacum TaxID=48773 RepID=UPI003F5A8B0A
MDTQRWKLKMNVAVRLRPPREESDEIWKVENNRVLLHGIHTFDFVNVFDKDCSNGTVYQLLIKKLILGAMEGFHATAFAYGQTNSGKTFTMTGTENDPGIIHRAVKDLFANIKKSSNRKFVISVSYMEIYNEEIIDLLAAEKKKLEIKENLLKGVHVAGLRVEIVNSVDEAFSLIQVGEARRHFGDMNMNARSSMSHTIFRMNLVDLAGSERAAQTQAGGVCLREGEHNDKSLTLFCSIINKLSDDENQSYQIPYGDSKLTDILRHTVRGKEYTTIICTIAPEQTHIEETKRTLEFASRAKKITICVKVNKIDSRDKKAQKSLDKYEILCVAISNVQRLEEIAKKKEDEKDEESEEEEHGEEDEEEYDAGDYGERYSGSSEEDDV